jgi:PAS domain S-box-containing protein
MHETDPKHGELRQRLDDVQAVIDVLRAGQVDAVVCAECVALLRLSESREWLRESETRLRVALNACGGGIYEHTVPFDDTMYYSDRWAEILGYSQDELPPYDRFLSWYLEQAHPEHRMQLEQLYRNFVDGRAERFQVEVRLRHKQGHWIWVSDSAQAAQRDAQGRVLRLVGIMFDIGTRKRGDDELRASRSAALNLMEDAIGARRQAESAGAALAISEEQFRLVVENSRDGIYQMDLATGQYLFMSPALERLFGFTLNELMAMSADEMTERIHPEDRPTFRSYLEHVVAGDDISGPVEYRWKVKSGEYRWLSDNRKTVLDAWGATVSMVGVTRDITEKKYIEDELRQLNLNLEQRVRERTALADQRVRQLQTMAALLSKVEERERLRLGQILHDGLQQILVAVRLRLDRISKVRNDPAQFHTACVEAENLLIRCVAECRQLSHELVPQIPEAASLRDALNALRGDKKSKYGLDVTIDLSGNIDSVSPDLVGFLFRTLRELLFNVVKHAGVLEAEVALRKEDGRLVFSVRDRGRGFDPDKLSKRGSERGLGLFGLRQRVQLLGGELHIESAPGKGCFIQITVPDPETETRG